MRKLSLFFIIFLLFIGRNAFASLTTPSQSLMTENGTKQFTLDKNTYTSLKKENKTFTVEDRDTGTWGTYNYNNSEYYGYYDDDPSTPIWSGWYLGTVSGNNSDEDLLALIQYYFGDPFYSIEGIDKVDVVDGNTSGDLTVTWDDDLNFGTWETTGGSSSTETLEVEFYVVKGSNEYALYYMDPGALAGYWTTTHLLTNDQNSVGNIPALSHLTVTYSVSNGLPETNPTPEPGTILLLGVGLIGVAGIGRRKFQK